MKQKLAASSQPPEPTTSGEQQASETQVASCSNQKPETNDKQAASPASAVQVRPTRQPRPLRRIGVQGPVMVAATTATGELLPVGAPAAIELASAVPLAPPKRPANLPARYATLGGPRPKPNRYAWAQMQHWPPPPAAGEAGLAGARSQPTKHPHAHHQQQHGFQHHFSAASRVLVVNPMQIVNLSEHTKSRLIKIIEALKRFSEQWFSHVLLLLFLAVYACFGAYIFISFEASSEQSEKQQIIETRQRILNESYQAAQSASDQAEFVDLFRVKLEEFERLLNKACNAGMTSSSLENQWTFWGALFYSMTVFTTIGYGHLTPITFAGRVATMVYAIFGIPILLMVLADLGKLLTRIIKYAFKKFRYLFNKLLGRKSSVRTRKLISENTNQYMGVARHAFERGFAHIQPYNRIVDTWRTNSLRWRSRRAEPEVAAAEPEASATADAANSGPVQQQADEPITSTDVIVTPVKQTKPVSPQPNEKKSLADHHSQSQTQSHHHSNNNNHNHSHHHHSRAHSPAAKRKLSSTNPSSGAKRSQAKNSVSRSSSSSIVTGSQQQNGNEKTPPKLEAEKANQRSTELETTRQHDDLPQPETEAAEQQQQGEAVGQFEIDEEEQLEEEEEEDEDDFDIPVSFALFLLITYMMFGAVVFSIWEGWNFFDSLYFVFISMSTIGFGDLVPQHPKRMIGTFIYLLFGLALTSMCINVVQEKIHATFLRAKMQIGEKMGLDLEQIMADDYYDNSMADVENDEDFNSVAAVSEANDSSSHQQLAGQQDGGCASADAEQADSSKQSLGGAESGLESTSGSFKLPPASGKAAAPESHCAGGSFCSSAARQASSANGKRRAYSGLPGHMNSSGLLRQKSGTKKSPTGRQPQLSEQRDFATPVVVPVPVASAAAASAPAAAAQPEAVPLKAELCGLETGQEIAQLETNSIGNPQPAAEATQPSINQPIDSLKGVCLPLQSEDKLPVALGGPPAVLQASLGAPAARQSPTMQLQPVAKSLSSESAERAHSRLNSTRSPLKPHQGQARSAGSSRRSSVSHELNELDDLIVALSKSPSERFGPLLGVPSSGRSSLSPRSNSPLSMQNRRGTSMMARPSALLPASNAILAGSGGQHCQKPSLVGNSRFTAFNSIKNGGGYSLPHRQPQNAVESTVGSMTRFKRLPNKLAPINLSESQRALDELEAIKFSAV